MAMENYDAHALPDAFEAEDQQVRETPLPNTTLTGRQTAFCEAYAEAGNGAAAARQAGYAEGSARVTGARLLTNANILERIEALKAVRNRARNLDRQLLLERLEETWQAAMAAGQFNAAMRALRLMAELGGLLGAKARDRDETAEEEAANPAGPVCRAVANAAHHSRHGRTRKESTRRDSNGKDTEADAQDGSGDLQDLVLKARVDLARTRPDPIPPGDTVVAHAFMGTPPFAQRLKAQMPTALGRLAPAADSRHGGVGEASPPG
jgi:phage terminase small subunit